jgi:hypothetical protein
MKYFQSNKKSHLLPFVDLYHNVYKKNFTELDVHLAMQMRKQLFLNLYDSLDISIYCQEVLLKIYIVNWHHGKK